MEETPLDATRKYVDGIIWPADKETLIAKMKDNGAPDDALQTLRDMDKDRFTAPSEVQNALWVDA